MSKFGRQRDRKIPLVRDGATRIYFSDDGNWPHREDAIVLIPLPQLQPGTTFEVTDLRPTDQMGRKTQYRILDQRLEVLLHAEKYSQLVVHVLVEEFVGYGSFRGDEL